MAGGFDITCPKCDREWNGVNHTIRIEPPLLSDTIDRYSLICPCCFTEATYPKRIEPMHWRRFVDSLPKRFRDGSFIRTVCDMVDNALGGEQGYRLVALPVLEIQCPDRETVMVEGNIETVRLKCPECGDTSAVFPGFSSLISLLRPE